MIIELDPVERITADAVGEPGQRVFYIQARKNERLVTLLVEKQQVQLLAASIVEILSRVGKETGQGPPEEQMGLEEPLLPEWRAGRLSIGYQEERDLVLLEAEELIPEEDEGDEVAALDPEGAVTEGELGLAEFTLATEVEEEEELEETELEGEERADPLRDLEDIDDAEALEELSELGREEVGEQRKARFWASREQMLSLARHGASVCAAGRPRCQLCGNPMDPEGHQCPALNGHRKLGEDAG